MKMARFHLVVSNYNRLSSFVKNFHRIRGFDELRDSVVILDCSPVSRWQQEVEIADGLTSYGLNWGANLYFLRRRNWGQNLGAQLDYFRCLLDQTIPIPQYSAFAQDHYFDLEHFVKEDTIPEDAVFDLDQLEAQFLLDDQVGCAFFARYGMRICTLNPITNRKKEFFGDGKELLPGAKRKCFFVDGGNFIVRPELYLNWFKAHPRYLVEGDGSYGFTIVWEERLGRILYDQRIKWVDAYRDLTYSSIQELDAIEESRGEKFSTLWYDNRVWSFFYGRDLHAYPPSPVISMLRYFKRYLRNHLTCSKDLKLTLIQPSLSIEECRKP